MGHTALTFRCSKCKVGRDWKSMHHFDMWRGTDLAVTGKMRVGKVGRRHNVTQVEYVCRSCRHRGWSSHRSMVDRCEEFLKERERKRDETGW